MRRFSIALGALTVRNFRNLTASPDHTPALVALIEERDRLKVERDDLVSRAEVLRVLRRLGDQDADLALYGAEDNARAREYGEAAMTRARCAVAIMPSSAGMSEAELREAVRGSVGLGLDAEDAADEVIRRIFGERS